MPPDNERQSPGLGLGNGPMLRGRTNVITRLQQVVGQARSGHGSATVLRGDAGMGKSTLLALAAESAQGMDIVRFRGVEAEQAIPNAGVQLLSTRLRADLTSLDGPQLAAMEKLLGRAEGEPDPFLVGLATLSMLTAAARRRPTLCLIDDAQWLDDATAEAVAFVLRRLDHHALCVLIATRTAAHDAFDEFPALQLTALSDADVRTLLRTASIGPIDEAVLPRIIAEIMGNPRAVLEVVADLNSADVAGGYGIARDPAPSAKVLSTVTVRMSELDAAQRQFLVLAAADPTGDPALLWRAADVCGLDRYVASVVEDQGLVRLGPQVAFGSPTERTAVYCGATTQERHAAHQALAEATDPAVDPDRRTWHLACATTGPNDTLAAELESHAARAHGRTGRAGAAAFLERSALLTQDTRLRAERALTAAAERFQAGSASGAARMLMTADLARLDRGQQVRFHYQQARLRFFATRNGSAAEQLLRAAQALHPSDEELACEAFLEALLAATYGGRLGPGADVLANKMPVDWTTDSLTSWLLTGLATRFTESFESGYEALRSALHRADTVSGNSRWLWLAARVAADLWDADRWERLTVQALFAARETGSIMLLPYALTSGSLAQLHQGNFDAAQRLVEQLDSVTTATQAPPFHSAALLLAGWRGDEQAAVAAIESARRDGRQRGEGIVLTTAALSTAVLYNGLGRYDAALVAARDAAARDELATFGWSIAELIEAAARAGQYDAGKAALAELTERTRITSTDWALGIEARSRALLTNGPEAEPLYQEAVERLSSTRITVHLARAQLVYGEWLRRQGRRVDARTQLRAAGDTLTMIGAAAFAERAHREYLATGETVRRPVTGCRRRLTPQESRIAALAREGLTNPEIGERLYLSPRTVEYHLHKVFAKLGISSRRDLLHASAEPCDAEGGAPG